MKKCKIEGCDKNGPLRKGMCSMHYDRYKRHGDPLSGRTSPGAPMAFYLDKVLNYAGDECLIWPFAKNKHGYGQVYKDWKMQLVSRIACEEENGPPPTPKHHAAHSCGKGHLSCCNRKHLSWKTPLENSADRIIHGIAHRSFLKSRQG